MHKIEVGRYAVLIRDDYLGVLHRVPGFSDRDSSIQNAILEYLGLPEDVSDVETENQRIDVLASAEAERSYTMVLVNVHIADDIVERLLDHSTYGITDLDRNVNAAIRLWLVSRGVEVGI